MEIPSIAMRKYKYNSEIKIYVLLEIKSTVFSSKYLRIKIKMN
jgi:hypothetical protein